MSHNLMSPVNLAKFLLAASLLAGCTPGLAGLIGANTGSTTGSNTASASVSLPDPLEIASVDGLKASSCSEESSLKSGQGAATNVNFKNNASGKINIYWLDFSGKRVSYKQGLSAGATHQQGTFVTHPWVITNDQDQCMGIYTPTNAGSVTLDVKKTVVVANSSSSSSGSGSASGSLTVNNATEASMRQGIECLKAKGKSSEALAAQASLNLYLQANNKGGIFAISAQAYLKQTVDLIAQGGC